MFYVHPQGAGTKYGAHFARKRAYGRNDPNAVFRRIYEISFSLCPLTIYCLIFVPLHIIIIVGKWRLIIVVSKDAEKYEVFRIVSWSLYSLMKRAG